MKRGDVYLVDFGKSKESFSFGKKRPVIIYQTDKLNYAVAEEIYDYFLVIPLSTQSDILTDEFRVRIAARDALDRASYAVVNSLCFLHKDSFHQKLTHITEEEDAEIKRALMDVFDLG